MGYWAKDGSYVREASDDAPRMTQGDSWEAGQRVIKGMQNWEAQEKRRKESEQKLKAEFYEIEKEIQNSKKEARIYESNKMKGVQIIIEQKRQNYNKKSWFGKAIAKLRGKTFAKMRPEIEEYATRRVENMSAEELAYFIENNSEEKGRSR